MTLKPNNRKWILLHIWLWLLMIMRTITPRQSLKSSWEYWEKDGLVFANGLKKGISRILGFHVTSHIWVGVNSKLKLSHQSEFDVHCKCLTYVWQQMCAISDHLLHSWAASSSIHFRLTPTEINIKVLSETHQYHAVPFRTVPYRTVPYRTVPYRTVPYPTISYLPCRALSNFSKYNLLSTKS